MALISNRHPLRLRPYTDLKVRNSDLELHDKQYQQQSTAP